MDKITIGKTIELINEIVRARGYAWTDKRDIILDEMTAEEKTSLMEFVSWFEET